MTMTSMVGNYNHVYNYSGGPRIAGTICDHSINRLFSPVSYTVMTCILYNTIITMTFYTKSYTDILLYNYTLSESTVVLSI